jgi:hypothetical protein
VRVVISVQQSLVKVVAQNARDRHLSATPAALGRDFALNHVPAATDVQNARGKLHVIAAQTDVQKELAEHRERIARDDRDREYERSAREQRWRAYGGY